MIGRFAKYLQIDVQTYQVNSSPVRLNLNCYYEPFSRKETLSYKQDTLSIKKILPNSHYDLLTIK